MPQGMPLSVPALAILPPPRRTYGHGRPDGYLWIMTGPLGGDHRLSREFETATGATQVLRLTRFNVSPDGFESRMEFTADGGRTWTPGNHQRFRRAVP